MSGDAIAAQPAASSGGIDAAPNPLLSLPPDVREAYYERRAELWAAYSGLVVDGHDFDLGEHSYLYPLFADRAEFQVLMKAAQMGATIYSMVRSHHMARYPRGWGFNHPIKVGLFYPDWGNVHRLVSDRVKPFCRASAPLKPYSKEQALEIRHVAESSLYFLNILGLSTKDSVPMNAVFFDELRLMSMADVEQVYARVLHSRPYKYLIHTSTAGYPDEDIHKLFLTTDRKWYHTRCEHCGEHQVLCLEFPNCIREVMIGPQAGQCFYICRKCHGQISDSQNGRYIAERPDEIRSGFQISQLVSRRITPKQILEKYRSSSNKKEFYNSILGLPYIDIVNKPISISGLERNIDTSVKWGDWSVGANYMGIDQMMGLNYVTIVNREGNRRELIWFEVIESEDPFRRCAELMASFNIRVCVCDALPNANEALRFARTFTGRVFLANTTEQIEPVQWLDRAKKGERVKRANPATYYQFRVTLDAYQSIDYTLSLLAAGAIVWGVPEEHIQSVTPLLGGRCEPMAVMRTHAYPHYACAVRETVRVGDEGSKIKMQWHYIGHDPHALDALNFAVFASERMSGGVRFL